MAEIIDGKRIAAGINDSVKAEIQVLSSSVGQSPELVSVSVGRNEEAKIYVNMQQKAAELAGVKFSACELDMDVSYKALAGEIEKLNLDAAVTGIIVQKPLPEGMDHDRIRRLIIPEKDVEGVHPYNLGRVLRGEADIVPCTPGAVMEILRAQKVDLYGKEVVIIGHSNIVGKPLSLMMLNEMATTTVCHIGTAEKGDLSGHAKGADILVVAVGKAEMVRGDWIKEGAVVIDVGINKRDGGIVGDVKFSEAAEHASAITPVPGGVGPVTVSILMRNILKAYRSQNVRI